MKRHEFETLIIEAIDALPKRIRDRIEDVVIVIEKRPRKRVGRRALPGRQELLLGLYEGVPLTVWGRDFGGKLPDKITIFQEPIERIARSPDEMPRVVRETIWHEIGHYFGLGEKRLRQLEKQWESRK